MSLSNQIDIDNLNVDDIMKIIDYYNNKSNEIINVKVKRKKMSDEERKERNRERALQRYYDNRDTILTNKKNKYHNDMAYQQKVKNASKNNYLKDLETNQAKLREYYYKNKDRLNKMSADAYKEKQDKIMENSFVYVPIEI